MKWKQRWTRQNKQMKRKKEPKGKKAWEMHRCQDTNSQRETSHKEITWGKHNICQRPEGRKCTEKAL